MARVLEAMRPKMTMHRLPHTRSRPAGGVGQRGGGEGGNLICVQACMRLPFIIICANLIYGMDHAQYLDPGIIFVVLTLM